MLVEQTLTVGTALRCCLLASRRHREHRTAGPQANACPCDAFTMGSDVRAAVRQFSPQPPSSLYLRAARRSSPRPAAWRAAAFVTGALMIALAVNSQLETIAVDYLVLFHLLQNVIIADWAPPL